MPQYPDYFGQASLRQPLDLPRTLDQVFSAYLQNKKMSMEQEQLAKAQKRQDAEDFLKYNLPLSAVTPEAIARVQGAPGTAPAGPWDASLRDFLARRNRMQGLEEQKAEREASGAGSFYTPEQTAAIMSGDPAALAAAFPMGVPKAAVGPAASASRFGKPEQYYDPASGETTTLPPGTKIMPPGTGKEGKMLPPASILSVEAGQSVSQMLPELDVLIDNNKDIFGPLEGKARSFNPWDTKAQTLQANIKVAAQEFGRFMEDGVLRKEDELKYEKMFPQLGDTYKVAKNKLSIVRNRLAQKAASQKSTLGASGYDVSGLKDVLVGASEEIVDLVGPDGKTRQARYRGDKFLGWVK